MEPEHAKDEPVFVEEVVLHRTMNSSNYKVDELLAPALEKGHDAVDAELESNDTLEEKTSGEESHDPPKFLASSNELPSNNFPSTEEQMDVNSINNNTQVTAYDQDEEQSDEQDTANTALKTLESKEDLETEEGGGYPWQPPEDQLPWWYPRFRGRPVFYGTPEALGWACTAVAQAGILIGTGAFILPAIAKLAKEEAGCETEAPSGEELLACDGTVYGIKPSSLLTFMISIGGLASIFIIPLVGAVVDFTSHRRLIGRWVSVVYSLLILVLVFLSEDSWFVIAIILLVQISLGWAQTMLFNAYLPELTDDESRLNEFSKAFTVVVFVSMVVYLAVVIGIAMVFGFAENDVALARCSAVVAFLLSAVLCYASWGLLFQERMATHQLPEGQFLWTAGFQQVCRTTIKIYTDYRALRWFYISICFGDAAIQSLTIIAISYVTDLLEFDAQEVGAAALLLLLGSIPGALVGAWANKVLNPIRSSGLAILGMIIGTSCAALFLTGPGQQPITYCFAFLWGFGTGWKYTGDRVLVAGIIPEGQDAELMGFYMFCGQIFAWVPSLVYAVLNEAGVSQRVGMATLNVFFIGAFLAYCMMGDYCDAIRVADRLRVETIPSMQQKQQKLELLKLDVTREEPVEGRV